VKNRILLFYDAELSNHGNSPWGNFCVPPASEDLDPSLANSNCLNIEISWSNLYHCPAGPNSQLGIACSLCDNCAQLNDACTRLCT